MSQTELSISQINNDVLTLSDPQGLVQTITKNPALISEVIKQVDAKLKESRCDIETIKDRNVLKRMFASNTCDLAKAMMAQNEIMSSFFVLLQMLTFICKGNATLMCGIMSSISDSEKMSSAESSNLYSLAKSFLQEGIESAQNEAIREEALKRLIVNVCNLNDYNEKELKQRLAGIEHRQKEIENSQVKHKEEFDKRLLSQQEILTSQGQETIELKQRIAEIRTITAKKIETAYIMAGIAVVADLVLIIMQFIG